MAMDTDRTTNRTARRIAFSVLVLIQVTCLAYLIATFYGS